jgi:hypothetical protein
MRFVGAENLDSSQSDVRRSKNTAPGYEYGALKSEKLFLRAQKLSLSIDKFILG